MFRGRKIENNNTTRGEREGKSGEIENHKTVLKTAKKKKAGSLKWGVHYNLPRVPMQTPKFAGGLQKKITEGEEEAPTSKKRN